MRTQPSSNPDPKPCLWPSTYVLIERHLTLLLDIPVAKPHESAFPGLAKCLTRLLQLHPNVNYLHLTIMPPNATIRTLTGA